MKRAKIWPEKWQKPMVQPCLYREQKALLWPWHCEGYWRQNRLSTTAVAGHEACQVDNQRLYLQCLQSLQPQILCPNCLQETLARNPLYPFYILQLITKVSLFFNKENTFTPAILSSMKTQFSFCLPIYVLQATSPKRSNLVLTFPGTDQTIQSVFVCVCINNLFWIQGLQYNCTTPPNC